MSRNHGRTKVRRAHRARLVAAAAVLAALATAGLAAAGGAAAAQRPSGAASTLSQNPGDTVTWAEVPQDAPNYIFPINACCYSVANITDFQQLLYRPLYWFGNGAQPTVNLAESLAAPPVYAGDTVVVNLKPGLRWSDGEVVDARDVVLFMNILQTVKTVDWGDYTPGYFPDDLSAVKATGPLQVTFTVKTAVSPAWFTGSELSQVTPMPIAWDIARTGAPAGAGGCSSAVFSTIKTTSSPSDPLIPVSASAKACYAVYEYLADPRTGQAANPATYATNPLWQVVDGPWKLQSLDIVSGNADFVPNPDYRGPQKPYYRHFDEIGYTSDAAEYAALASGTGPDVGYLPTANAPQNPGSPLVPGPNAPALAANYRLAVDYPFEIGYLPMNFLNPTVGPIFRQQYARAAMQSLVDESGYVKRFDKGYGVATDGPVPAQPATYVSSGELHPPYPYDPATAASLLAANGWQVNKGGTSTCIKPGTAAGDCGAGIANGQPFSFTMLVATYNATVTAQAKALAADWKQAGINATLDFEPFSTVIATAGANCLWTGDCSWQVADWGGGWQFVPDYYPTGEQLFAGAAGCSTSSQLPPTNAGAYCDATNDANVVASISSSDPSALANYENYLAAQVPALWQPETPTLVEIADGLAGVSPVSSIGALNPEYWHQTFGGYWLAGRDGRVFAAGAAKSLGNAAVPAGDPVTGIASTPDRRGYWLTTASGRVSAFGDAVARGDLPQLGVNVSDVVAIAATSDGRGYWLIGRDGGEFAFGDARYRGSLPALGLHVHDVAGMVATSDGRGYWLVGADGGIFAFGDARFVGSLPGQGVHVGDIRAMIASPTRRGYILVGSDGGTFVLGSGTRFEGSLPEIGVQASDIVGLALDSDARGYWIAGADGNVYAFGNAGLFPPPAGLTSSLPMAAIAGA